MDTQVEYPCANCHRTNRFPRERLYEQPKCGACKQSMFPHAPVAVSAASFASEVEACPLPVLIDFWAPWCGPCHSVAPVLDAVSKERQGRVKVVKVNVDENPALAAKYGATSIPLLVLNRGSQVIAQQVGAQPKRAIDAWLNASI
jgi:thioredoxin 2